MSLDIKTIFGIALVVITITPALLRTFQQESDSDLRSVGRLTQAKLLDVRNTGQRFRHGPEVELSFQFQVDGRVQLAHCLETVSVADTARLQPGNTIEIVYDPKRPERVALASR